MRRIILSAFIFFFKFHTCICDDTISLNIEQGKLSGKVEKTLLKNQEYYSFKGIPYAKPPIGELRFQPPVKHEAWDSTYEAFTEKPTCYQFNARTRNNAIRGLSGSEDCLYLSVFTPKVDDQAPVIIFDYNDNFKSSFNGSDTYSPDFFIEENVLVVMINHRLGILGYLSTDDAVIPGNNGLRDFISGLQWVKKNIANFGGDPNRVTLMGNSGGASLIDLLLYSAKAKNLFDAAILHSGTSMQPSLFYEKSRQAAFKLGEILGINTTDSNTLLKFIQKVDAEQLYVNEGYVVDHNELDYKQRLVLPFSPIIESNGPDAILTSLPENGVFINDVPVIIGFNSREGLDLVTHYIFEPRLLTELDQEFFFHLPIRTDFRFDKNSRVYETVIRDIQNHYLKEGYLHYNNILEYAVYVGDILQNYALNIAAEKLSRERKSQTFYYMFDFRGLLNENSEYMSHNSRGSINHWGATITDELCYLFMCCNLKKTYIKLHKLPSEQPEFKVVKKMLRLWTNFAKYGNPTPDNKDELLKDFKWQPVSKKNSYNNYLHITKKLQMRENPLGERKIFWDNFIAKYSTSAKDGLVNDKIHEEL